MNHVTEQLRASMEKSPFGHLLDLRLLELSEGYARVAVTLRPEHTNFLGTVNGGLIMSLADYAFACSCNSFGKPRVAVQFSTNFIASPAVEGDLVAEAKTVYAGGSMALTEISVTDASGRTVAKATGTAMAKPGAGSATKGA